jgi:hypothetical protein
VEVVMGNFEISKMFLYMSDVRCEMCAGRFVSEVVMGDVMRSYGEMSVCSLWSIMSGTEVV